MHVYEDAVGLLAAFAGEDEEGSVKARGCGRSPY